MTQKEPLPTAVAALTLLGLFILAACSGTGGPSVQFSDGTADLGAVDLDVPEPLDGSW